MISIHRRTLVWLLLGLLAISGLAGIVTYRKMLEEVNEMQDFELRQIAYSIAYASRSMSADMKVAPQPLSDNPAFIVQIWRDISHLQYSSHPSVSLPLAARQGLSVVSGRTEQWRVYQLVAGGRTVQAAQTMEDRQDTAAEMVLRMLVPFLVLIPLLAGLAWIAVRRGLAPLGQVVEDIQRRDSGSLEALDTSRVPLEIRPLIEALNDLLARLGKALDAQRHFVADAAHELRTPLTALSLQAQLVEQLPDGDERSKAIGDLRNGIARSAHLVRQLLDLSRQEPDTVHAFTPVDLVELVRERLGDLAPLAADKDIDLGLTAEGEHRIDGDRASLGLLIGNLVDNAIRYTPAGGRVNVTLDQVGGQVLLAVEDNGPGIETEDRERIFERFYRPAGQYSPGSGLGLAIVSEVAKLHRASIEYAQPAGATGSLFSVRFERSRRRED